MQNTITNIVNNTDSIQEAFKELRLIGAIVSPLQLSMVNPSDDEDNDRTRAVAGEGEEAGGEQRKLPILYLQNTLITLNLFRLLKIGYVLLFEADVPMFYDIKRINYMNDCNFYFDNVVPLISLQSYNLIKMKNIPFSSK